MADVQITTDVTTNSQTIDITVYEDTNSDGTADNTESVNGVSDGVTTYNLTSLDGSEGNIFWIQFSLSTADTTVTPVVHGAELYLPFVYGSGALVQISGTALSSSDTAISNEQGSLVPISFSPSTALIVANTRGVLFSATATTRDAQDQAIADEQGSLTSISTVVLSATDTAIAQEADGPTTAFYTSETATYDVIYHPTRMGIYGRQHETSTIEYNEDPGPTK